MSHNKLLLHPARIHVTNKLLDVSKHLRNYVNILRHKTTKPKTASSVYRSMNIFDRKAKALQRERSARRDDYHLVEHIKEEVGWRTADRVFDIKRTFKNAVELGASRGYVSRHFLPDSVEKITLCDTSQTHLDKAIVGDGVQVEKLVMDEENIDFPENSLDLVVSSLALHWVNDLPGCFDKIMKSLMPDGVFMATVFGGDTLMELRQALQLADTERLGGMAPHISPFTRIRDIGGLLTAAGFTLQTVDVDSMTLWYPSAWHVMWDARAMGESNAAHTRPLRLSRDVQFSAAAIYDEMYGKDFPERNSRGVPATFQIINFLGWKPDPSQPKPLERGSGEVSLKDLHRIDEIVKETKKVQLTEDDMK
ncbi:arginine-hydroxylase NDUFAF5, mitochondrial isoform X1 [Galleria mellonella]|uniref:Arginine-hydroxylase NDUFAF5, mitochondrial isoform X1 n=1 Tax=Galleria mellonella TaxID=7137 RepID=A0ABM3MC97_GALME|nr:arginine-hydroxylase NDUFAF5, mitochondrial isoform X1 [Galleria mellonella]